ncbi:hypothetical protein [uncultured Aquimarina sp.]|uniref:hypothetical protein n=1 Tax=uncultured Aquimarina sp. TaxID=575652 RepID=UPI002615CD17|nr:hypothetical protein [uncultured Aquimarina sp.]
MEVLMRFVLEANGKERYNEFEIRITELFSTIFLITFFFDIGSLRLNNDVYELSLE